jgi:hypothetical protein
MTIALARKRRFEGFRYLLTGEISKNANWVQTLELPADGNAVSITGETVVITFRRELCDSPEVSITATVSDADTLSISATASDLNSLDEGEYIVDIKGTESNVVTHWAHGSIIVRNNPAE